MCMPLDTQTGKVPGTFGRPPQAVAVFLAEIIPKKKYAEFTISTNSV
jgi:hypothetical protein